ncbi:MAG: hypothetical protein CVU87_03465 [Firmicutes bacterium HGW-Firmicutes-12]|jgi:uncharacterized membrane protein|nr:MAG: hypothetical protein CVU87_03465 [Firmicutes bacterium HGW-Firmicutes-12]
MWTRKELKKRAKDVLKNIYWKALLISIVIYLAGGKYGSDGGGGGNNSNSNGVFPLEITDLNELLPYSISIFAVVLFFTILILSLRIFLGYPLEVGGRRYFIQSACYNNNKGCFRFAFDSNNYKGIVLTMLLRGVQNFLWFLLLIIPGIIKLYSYRMVPYILADNPNIGAKKAIRLSINMTMGHKFDIFVLDLSFLGWYLLGALALFIGTFFVMPYDNATNAELYLVLRQNALDNDLCTYEDLSPNAIEV